MLSVKNKILVAMLMLMVFIGQTTAATSTSCQMKTSDQNVHLSMDTTSHLMPGSETPSSMDDCYGQDCDCALGGCSSVMLLSSPHHVWQMIALHRKSDRLFQIARQPPAALYRPPISL